MSYVLLLRHYAAEVQFLVGVVDDGVAVAFGAVMHLAGGDGHLLTVEDNLAAAFEHYDDLAVGLVAVLAYAGVGSHAHSHHLVQVVFEDAEGHIAFASFEVGLHILGNGVEVDDADGGDVEFGHTVGSGFGSLNGSVLAAGGQAQGGHNQQCAQKV